MRTSLPVVLLVILFAGAALATADLRRAEQVTIVVYTTPALKDLLEKDVIPRYQNATGERVEPVYVAAGEEYNRLRLSGASPEADVFLHASPLYLEKGYSEGHFLPVNLSGAQGIDATFQGAPVDGGRAWYAFAWSPLLEVYSPRLGQAPDLATADVKFGLAHPLLSNNGVYNVLFYETLDPAAGRFALARTAVQPTDSRSTINGIADGSFDLTLGYEAVTLLYQAKGAKVATALPILHGEPRLVPVLFSAALVAHHHNRDAERFIAFLFTHETQSRLGKSYFRSVEPGFPAPAGGANLTGLAPVTYDWSQWRDLEAKLPDYEVQT